MKTRLLMAFALLLLVAALGSAGCSTPESPAAPPPAPTAKAEAASSVVPPPAVDPAVAIVTDMLARANGGDFAGAADLFSDEAMIYLVGMPPTGMEIYRGKDQFRTFLEECCTGQHFEWEAVPTRVEDGVVFTDSKTWMDFTRELGVAPNSWHEIFVVKNGRITLYYSSITAEALANFKPAIHELMPDLFAALTPAAPSGETPATELMVTFADGSCSYEGPLTLQAGTLPVTVDVRDQRANKYAVSFFTLDEGKDLLDLMVATNNAGPPSWSKMVFLKELRPGETRTYEGFNVEEGLLYLVCWSGSPDIAIGNGGPYVVQK